MDKNITKNEVTASSSYNKQGASRGTKINEFGEIDFEDEYAGKTKLDLNKTVALRNEE